MLSRQRKFVRVLLCFCAALLPASCAASRACARQRSRFLNEMGDLHATGEAKASPAAWMAVLTGIMSLLALVAPQAHAVTGGQNSATLGGQVQFWVAGEYECTGTLIDVSWVLTAKHCIQNTNATTANSLIILGDRQLGEGQTHTIAAFQLNPVADVALVQLAAPSTQPNIVVGYTNSILAVNNLDFLRGWGVAEPGGPGAEFLQIAVLRVANISINVPEAGPNGWAMDMSPIGQGFPSPGDSGAGISYAGKIYGVFTGSAGNTSAVAIRTDVLTPWIQQTTGVGPTILTANTTDLRLMPLGDSITQGYQSTTGDGYRLTLQADLTGVGDQLLYVGTQVSGTMTNPQNEGHDGWRIDQIAGIATNVLNEFSPNVVTLLIGTNDYNQNYDVADAPTRMHNLIDQIFAAAPSTSIVVAAIPRSSDANLEAGFETFNAAVQADVSARQNSGQHVLFQTTSDLDPVADKADSLHPNDSGYVKLGNDFDAGVEGAVDAGWVVAPAACSACNTTGSGGSGHPPGPVGPAPGAGAQTPLGEIASGVGAPAGSKVLFADINGDGKADYVVVDATTGSLTVWLNGGPNAAAPGGWVWYPQGTIASGVAPGATIQLADLNGDGKADYISVDPASGALNVYLNGGQNSAAANGWIWYPQGTIASGVAPGATIQFGDINGDGLADYLIVDPNSGAVQAYLNGGPNTAAPGKWIWYPQGTLATGVGAPAGSQVVFADINHDGYADYLSISSASGTVSAWLNGGGTAGNWIWIPQGQLSPGAGAPTTKQQIFEADIDGDGRADLVALNVATGAIHVWLDEGLDTTAVAGWQPVGQILSGVGFGAVDYLYEFGDLDGNGLADYAVVNALTNQIPVAYLNQGDAGGGSGTAASAGTWGWNNVGSIASGVGGASSYVILADINGDGKADYLTATTPAGAVTAYLNGGANAAGGWIWYPQGLIASGVGTASSSAVLFADIDGDGKADYLMVGSDGTVSAYLNKGANASAPNGWDWVSVGQIASGVGADPMSNIVRFADINGDGRADYLIVSNTNTVTAFLNGGPSASGWIWYPQGQIAGSLGSGFTGYINFADINGDGRADYIQTDGSGNITAWINNGGDTAIPAASKLPN